MAESISLILLLLGAIFMLLAAIGLARMPDVIMRLHSSTKSTTLGVGLIMLGVALRFNDFAISVRALAIVIFMFSTVPVAAHLIGRAAYLSGVPLWEGTLSDEMHGCYDLETHTLSGQAASSEPLPPQTSTEK